MGSERKAGCSQDARLGFAERSPLPLCSTLCRGQELKWGGEGAARPLSPWTRQWPPAAGMSSVSGKKSSDSGHSDSVKKKNSIDLYLLFLGILARTFPGTSPPLSRTGWGYLSLQIRFGSVRLPAQVRSGKRYKPVTKLIQLPRKSIWLYLLS